MDDTLGISHLDDAENEDEEAMTSAEVLSLLEQAWLNEKFSPEILPNKSEIVDCMLDQLNVMQQNVERSRKGDFKVCIHKMEIDRIRFILSSYLRTRLQKIECFTSHILENESYRNRLTPEELTFAKEYNSGMEQHLKSVALRHMPHNLQALDAKEIMNRPNLDSFVFLRIDKDVKGVVIEEETEDAQEEVMDLTAGDQHIMSFRPLPKLIESGHVSLI